MIRIRPAPLRAARAAGLLLLLGVLAACSGGSGSGTVGGGGSGGGNKNKFLWEDLTGAWVGQLAAPAGSGVQPRNAYLRWTDLRLTEAAESGGLEWTVAGSTRSFRFTALGVLSADLSLTSGSGRLLLDGRMDATRSVLQGSYRLTDAGGILHEGDFSFVRSAGAGQFSQDLLTGRWDGLGRNGLGKFRFLKLELDAAGVVTDGLMNHPDTEIRIRDYSAGSGTFAFADTSVGRINGVVLVSDQGETLTIPFLLLDADRNLLAGAGVESGLGAGIAELVPAM